MVRNAARAVHGAELLVQHASEGKQIVTLVLQGNARRTDARWILRFAPMKFLDDEVDISYRFCGAAHEIHRGPIHFPKLFTSQSCVKANERKGEKGQRHLRFFWLFIEMKYAMIAAESAEQV
ncbi:hypothetical protein [Paraburkholderia sp. Clong3]|uniref:hypothetical protein n=1 Tax=Paraburkholderia sp. Clong3 TaxID=2991061 RepID=UPI003D1C92D3